MPVGIIRVGVGGWNFDPWNISFYPPDLKKKDQLSYAASKFTAIEINATYYGSQKPETFANWASQTPPGFQFSVKASRYATNRRILAEAGPSIEKMIGQGIARLGDRLGPIVWQFAPTKIFDADDMAAFISLIPRDVDGIRLRHAFEVRHPSFDNPDFLSMMRTARFAIVYAQHHDSYPSIDADTADFRYVRLMGTTAAHANGYSAAERGAIAALARTWGADKDVYLFVIAGAKEKNPAAAMALLDIL